MGAQISNILLGIWLMAAPAILKYNGVAADNSHIIGPVVSTFAIIALSACTRAVGKYNLPFGVWLLAAPWLLDYEKEVAVVNDMCVGFLITIFSFFERKANRTYGGGWVSLWKSDESREVEARTE